MPKWRPLPLERVHAAEEVVRAPDAATQALKLHNLAVIDEEVHLRAGDGWAAQEYPSSQSRCE